MVNTPSLVQVSARSEHNVFVLGIQNRGLLKLAFLLFVLVLEVLLVSLMFDSRAIEESLPTSDPTILASAKSDGASSWFVWLLARSSRALRVAVVAAAITLILSGKPLLEELDRTPMPSFRRHGLPWLVVHLVAFVAFLAVCEQIFEGGVIGSPTTWLWILAWISLSLILVGALLAAVMGATCWARVIAMAMQSSLAGCAAGLVAVAAGQMTSQFWLPLARMTLDSVYAVLRLVEQDVVFDPSGFIVGTSAFSVRIAPECSGYEGIGLILAFAGVYLLAFRHSLRFPHALLILPIGAVAIWLANIVRIAALIEVGSRLSSDIARGGFHSQAGWIAFNIVGLSLVVLARYTRLFQARDGIDDVVTSDRSAGGSVVGRSPVADAVYLTPLIAIVSATMFTAAFSTGGFDKLYPLRLAAVAIPFWLFRKEYRSINWSVGWPSVVVGIVVYLLWIARSILFSSPASQPSLVAAQAPAAWAGLWLAARMIGSIITVPVAEELAFRGFLTRRLISADVDSVPAGHFTWISFVASSVAFGLLHHHWPEGIAAGMLYALAYYRRGSMGDAVVAHATTNAILSVQAVVVGDWSIIS